MASTLTLPSPVYCCHPELTDPPTKLLNFISLAWARSFSRKKPDFKRSSCRALCAASIVIEGNKKPSRFVLTQRAQRPRRSLRKREAAGLVLVITKEASLLELLLRGIHRFAAYPAYLHLSQRQITS